MEAGMSLSLPQMLKSAPSFVRRPSKEEVLEILQDRSVYVPWGIYAEDVGNIDTVVLLNDRVLLQILPDGDDIEVHVCCKYRDRIGARKIMRDTIEWLKECGAKTIYTINLDESRAALVNMIKRLGFVKDNERWAICQ